LTVLRDYAAHIVASKLTWRLQILAGLAVLPSADEARQLRKARADSIIPTDIVERIEAAESQEAEGVAIAAEQLREIAGIPGISGVTLVTPGNAALIPEAIKSSGLRQ
jgi:methylenetetrahydrofolate reductase (NADPH)